MLHQNVQSFVLYVFILSFEYNIDVMLILFKNDLLKTYKDELIIKLLIIFVVPNIVKLLVSSTFKIYSDNIFLDILFQINHQEYLFL